MLSIFEFSSERIFKFKYREGLNSIDGVKSAASFCRQVAAWFPDMFSKFYLVKNHKIANNSTTAEAREKISTD
jgi:hypothetical protein